MSYRLTLRSKNSPFTGQFTDINLGSVLSHTNLDDNFINIKGNLIYTGVTSGNVLVLSKINGEVINIDLDSIIPTGDTSTTGATLIGSTIYFDTTTTLSAYTVDLNPIISGSPYEYGSASESIQPKLGLNFSSSKQSNIGGGTYNVISGESSSSFIGGGSGNNILNYSYNGVIAGGNYNKLDNSSYYTAILGGSNNITDSSIFSNVVGGYKNNLSNVRYGSIIGGKYNTISGNTNYSSYSFIGGGSRNTINNSYSSVIVGGGYYGNTIRNHNYGFIGAGQDNIIIDGNYSFIGSGRNNEISNVSSYSNIIGGTNNTINSSYHSNIVGGSNHQITGTTNAFIGGGNGNRNFGYGASIVGGTNNRTRGPQSFIGGGFGHKNYGYGSSVIGGANNTINYANYATIVNGTNNTILDGAHYSAIIGCSNLTVSATNTTYMCNLNVGSTLIVNGSPVNSSPFTYTGNNNLSIIPNKGNNSILLDRYYSSILGGKNNYIMSYVSMIGGGVNNYVFGYYHNIIIGGLANRIESGAYNIIGGGNANIIATDGGTFNSIFGGYNNVIDRINSSMSNSTIVAGQRHNIKQANDAFIGGGDNNEILQSSHQSFIGGGIGNTISSNAQHSTIIGGGYNTINSGHNNSHIIGSAISSISANTTHVDRLNISSADTSNSATEILVRENNGMVNTMPLSGFSDIVMFDEFGDFPIIGDEDLMYIAKNSNTTYRYDSDSSQYIQLNTSDNVDPDAPEEGSVFFAELATSNRLQSVTYNNGSGGIGATLTSTANIVLSEINTTAKIDATTPTLGQIILIKNQVSAFQNGLYEVTQLGQVGVSPFILTRIDGYDESDEVAPSTVFVSAGANNKNRYFTQNTKNPTIGVSNLVYGVATTSQPSSPIFYIDTYSETNLDGVYANGPLYPSTLPAYQATLTGLVNGALGTVNGVNMTSGKTLILNGQNIDKENGDWKVTNAGSATQKWVLTRISYNASGLQPLNRSWKVTNPDSTYFGATYTQQNTPITNANIGVSQSLSFIPNYSLQRVLEGGDIMYNNQSIFSEDGFGELKMGWDYASGFESYIYRGQDSNNEARIGLYTDNKGIVVWDSPIDGNDAIVVYSDNVLTLRNGPSVRTQLDGEFTIENTIGDVTVIAEVGNIVLSTATGNINMSGIGDGIDVNDSDLISINTTNTANSMVLNAAGINISSDNNNSIVLNPSTDVVTIEAGNNLVLNAGNAIQINGVLIRISGLQTFADNAAATTGGIPVDYLYKTATGQLMIRY